MKATKMILWALLAFALLYGGLLAGERLTRQELTHITNSESGESVRLMWQPKLLRGNGVCYLNLLNAQGKVIDTTRLRVLANGFDALQQCGQVEFKGPDIFVSNLRTGETVQHYVVREGRLSAPD
ncbi:hypothetical protein BH09VER1_BH09VER1_38760 [soil metagenome]